MPQSCLVVRRRNSCGSRRPGDAKADGRSRSWRRPLTTLHKVLQNLLDEKVPIRICALFSKRWRNMRPSKAIHIINRRRARGVGTGDYPAVVSCKDEVHVIGLDTPLERLLLQRCRAGEDWSQGWRIVYWRKLGSAIPSGDVGCAACIVGEPPLRPLLSRFLRRSLPQLVVLRIWNYLITDISA